MTAADVGRRLDDLTGDFGFATIEPRSPDWVTWAAIVEPPILEKLARRWLELGKRRDAAGSLLSARVTHPVVSRSTAALLLGRVCLDLEPSSVHLHQVGDKFDQVAFTREPIAVACASANGRSLDGQLVDRWATEVVRATDPILQAIRRRLGFSHRGMWAGLAARVAATAIALDRRCGGVGEDGWRDAGILLDALQRSAPTQVVLPTALPVAGVSASAWYAVKGTCCLKHHTKPVSEVTTGVGYCTTCPLVDPDTTLRRLQRKLDG